MSTEERIELKKTENWRTNTIKSATCYFDASPKDPDPAGVLPSNQPGDLYYHHLYQTLHQEHCGIKSTRRTQILSPSHHNLHLDQSGNLTELSLRTAISSERRPRLLELLLSMSWGSNQAKEQTLDSYRSEIHIKPKGYGKVYICMRKIFLLILKSPLED